MLTGVEIAGLVLAVIPLCISALEHYDDELRPFRALFAYRTDLRERADELRVILSDFDQTTAELFEAAVAIEKHELDERVRRLDYANWAENQTEEKLKTYLTKRVYDEGYRIRVETILSKVRDIARIMGLNLSNDLDSRSVWMGVRQEQRNDEQRRAQVVATSHPSSLREVKASVTYILQSGRLGPRLESLDKDVQRLAHVLEVAGRRRTIKAASKKSALNFKPSPQTVRKHALRLHRALGTILSCPDHVTHCLNLVMTSRIEDRDPGTADKTCFEVAIAPTPDSREWHYLYIDVEEDSAPASRRRVGVANETQASQTEGWQVIDGDLCAAALKQRLDAQACSLLKIDAAHRLLEKPAPRGKALTRFTCEDITSMKCLIRSLQDQQFGPTAYGSKQALMLGLTITSTFLQLYSTPWLRENLSTEDIVFLRAAKSVETSRAFVSLMLHRPDSNAQTQNTTPTDGERALLGLAAILLEICLRRTIESCDPHTKPASPDVDMGIFYVISYHFRAGELRTEFPCFHDAIHFCLVSFLTRQHADLTQQEAFQEFVAQVVMPFQRDLAAYTG